MLEIGGKPILETIVEQFVEQGFADILVAVNYRKDMIQDHFTDGAKWGAVRGALRKGDAADGDVTVVVERADGSGQGGAGVVRGGPDMSEELNPDR